LQPALTRGKLHCIGATTLDEYRKHVERDAALARRFADKATCFATGFVAGQRGSPKPLPARIKGWQRNGSLVEMTSLEIRGRRVLKPRI
jgi:hypothetical protein